MIPKKATKLAGKGRGRVAGKINKLFGITGQKHAEDQKALLLLLAETKRHLDHLTALHAVTAAASKSLDLDNVLREVVRKITQIFHFDATRIYLFDPPGNQMHLRASYSIRPVVLPDIWSIRGGHGHARRVAKTGRPAIYDNIETDLRYENFSQSRVTRRTGHRFFAAFPIKSRLRTVGTIVCVGRDPRHLSRDEIQLISSMASQIGIAVANATLFSQLRDRTVELENANKVKTEFLNVVSHELRTPLNAIVGYTGLVQVGAFGEINSQQENALEQVAAQSRELLRMINDILEVPKIEAGLMTVQAHEFRLEELLEELRKAYDHPFDREVALIWDYSWNLPPLRTDSWKLGHILRNLLNNAIKFTDKGTITVSARYRPQTETIEFRVADEGIGISKEALPLIFEKFRQVDSSNTRRYGGVGLGLYIAKSFTELLGGAIDVESQPAVGSTFKVTMPKEYGNASAIRPGEAPEG